MTNTKEKVLKEIKELQKMLSEEEGSLWASENETYMREKRDRLKELRVGLRYINRYLAEVGKVIDDFWFTDDKFIKFKEGWTTLKEAMMKKELKKELGIK